MIKVNNKDTTTTRSLTSFHCLDCLLLLSQHIYLVVLQSFLNIYLPSGECMEQLQVSKFLIVRICQRDKVY